MSWNITLIVSFSFIAIACVFYLVGWIHFKMRLTIVNSISEYGRLVGFRQYYTMDQWRNPFIDYVNNKRGRVPIIEVDIDGEKVNITAVRPNYLLTEEDIGKQVKIRYRFYFGIIMIIDETKSLEDYNQLQNIIFLIFISIATILLVFGLLTGIFMPRVFNKIIF